MFKIEIPTGTFYANLDIHLPFNDFFINIVAILHETNCINFSGLNEHLYHLIFYKDGKINFIFKDKNYYINPETFVFISPNQKHNETIEEENLKKYHIIFNILTKKKNVKEKYLNVYQQESNEIFKAISHFENMQFVQNTSNMTHSIFEQIIHELDNSKFGYNFKISYLFSEIFIQYCRDLNAETFHYSVPLGSPSLSLITYAISSHIGLHFKDITLKMLAKSVNLSERQVQRNIKKNHNTTFKGKLNGIKIERAKNLIKTTKLSIQEISKEVGFKNILYFEKVFSEIENMTADEYRNS